MAVTAIVTRTKDRPLLLKRAIEGILAQTSSDWVHVIVNDGGAREPVDALAREFAEPYRGRLRVLHNPSSLGMEAASNLGVRSTMSALVLIHDDDDSLQRDFLARTQAYMASSSASVNGVATLANLVTEQVTGDRVSTISKKLFRRLGPCLLAAEVAASNPVPPISFAFRRSAFDALGGFNESLPVLGDWDFLLRFIAKYDVGVIQDTLANYHVRNAGAMEMGNSIVDGIERHRFYANIVRNRILRDGPAAMAVLVQQGAETDATRRRLEHLYSHRVIGGLIRFWAKFVNSDIPGTP